MKRFKIVLASLAVATVIVGAFAFTPKKVTTTFYYHGVNQRIPSGTSGQTDQRENSLTVSPFTNEDNWNTTSNGTFEAGNYIAALTFNYEADSDGSSDGLISVQEAIDAAWAYYNNNSQTLPADNATFTITLGSVVVTVHRKDAVSN